MILVSVLLLTVGGQAQDMMCDKHPVPTVSAFDASNPRAAEEASGDGLWIGGQSFGATDVAASKAVQSGYSSEWVVDIEMTAAGRTKFVAAQRCRLGKAIEISVDGKVITAPILQEYVLGNRVQLTGSFVTEAEAAALASRIAAKKD